MSNRLDQEREKRLQPTRMESGKKAITDLGYAIEYESSTELIFTFNGKRVHFWPYSGWHSGATIKDGRGLNKLLRQLTQNR